MSVGDLTFYYYINNVNTCDIEKFLEIFKENIHKIPKGQCSSKKIMTELEIDRMNMEGFQIFKMVFMEYFIYKLRNARDELDYILEIKN